MATGDATRTTVTLFGVQVDALTMDQTVEAVRAMVATGTPHQHVVVNAAKLVNVEEDPSLADVINSCDLCNADGAAVVWASKILGRPLPERVAGIDLFERLVGVAAEDGRSVYFLGAHADTVAKVAEDLGRRHPGLIVAGHHDGYWDDDDAVAAEVRASGADYLFLAIPSPRKEFWLNKYLDTMGVSFVMGVGGSFDVVAGKTARAPKVFQKTGMEWSWRIIQEPRRMWKRYLVGNSKFIKMVTVAWFQERRHRRANGGKG